MRTRALATLALLGTTLVAPLTVTEQAASAGPAPAAAPAKACGPDFRTVVRKPIREVATHDRIGTLMIRVRVGDHPAYCGDAAFVPAYRTAEYATSLFMITDDYLGQLYDGTYSPNPDPVAVCLSTAAVETGDQLRLQVRVFTNDRTTTPPVAKAAGRIRVATAPTVPSPFRTAPHVDCYEQDVD